jgi:hypothetical protein
MSKGNIADSKDPLKDPNFIKQISDQVLRDIEYIKNFKSLAPKAKPIGDFKNAKIVKAASSAIYPQVYGFLIKNYNKEICVQKLRGMGARAVTVFYSIHPQRLPKKGNPLEVLKEIGAHSGEKIKVEKEQKKDGVLSRCIIRKYKCIFCTGGYPVETKDAAAYCYPSVAFWQQYYNIRSLYNGNMKPRLIYIDVIKTAENDDDYCLYSIEAID